jgi:UDP-N-acetylmuramoyl-tripeptide--D-alanyl-D-alanine ligase
MEVTELPDGTTVINDAYNANPESMVAALKALAAMGRRRTTWAVLGEMRELGDGSIGAHDEVGRRAVRLGVDRLVGIGQSCRPMVVGAAAEGYYGGEAHFSPDVDDAAGYLRENLTAGDVVLFKASRAAGLERLAMQVIEELTVRPPTTTPSLAAEMSHDKTELVEGSSK